MGAEAEKFKGLRESPPLLISVAFYSVREGPSLYPDDYVVTAIYGIDFKLFWLKKSG